jgi:hypothetical protein
MNELEINLATAKENMIQNEACLTANEEPSDSVKLFISAFRSENLSSLCSLNFK